MNPDGCAVRVETRVIGRSRQRERGRYPARMGYGFSRFGKGAGYLLRGLRDGRIPLVVLGCFIIVRSFAGRRVRDAKVTDFRLDPGSRVELRVK